MRAPRHLGCNGRIVAIDKLRSEAWCTCRRRWNSDELMSELLVTITASTRAFIEAIERMHASMIAAARAMAQVMPYFERERKQ